MYLLMMVLLPAVHILTVSTADASLTCACDSSEAAHQPKKPSHHHHEHTPGSCPICRLMMMPLDFSEILISTHFSVLLETVPAVSVTVISRQHIRCEQARAPPIKTV
jgi:hypothetical protein